ncbi:MAG TPA: HAD family hydrolase [Solirubrobacteraceae bacterium]
MSIAVALPEGLTLRLEHLLLDVNGTLSDRGRLHEGVAERLDRLRGLVHVQLVSADTFGTLDDIARSLGVGARRVSDGGKKRELVARLGADRCAVIGNGANDMLALQAAALGIAVLGREGLSVLALRSADVFCASITDALDLLLDVEALIATLRK